jgi:ABC-type antimicrobial peptide transport system permease subunit
MALGAQPGEVIRSFLVESGWILAAGVVLGLGAVLPVSGLVASLLYGLSPLDAATLAAVVAILTVVTIGAAAIPARRAARIDPVIALKAE